MTWPCPLDFDVCEALAPELDALTDAALAEVGTEPDQTGRYWLGRDEEALERHLAQAQRVALTSLRIPFDEVSTDEYRERLADALGGTIPAFGEAGARCIALFVLDSWRADAVA